MKYFDYTAKAPVSGKRIRGIITGDDQIVVADSLKARGVTVLEISPMADVLGIRKFLYAMSARIKKADIRDFFSQLSFMLSANLQLYNALTTLRDYSVNKKQRMIARPIAEETRKGASLHEAMSESGLFEYAAVQQVKSGEESGDVPNALKRIERQYQRELEFTGKIKNALVYPILITVVMIVVLWVLLTMVVPSLANTLTNLGGELPMLTRIVIGVSNFASKSTPYFILLAVLGIIAYKILMKQPDFKCGIDGLKLKIPLIGAMIIKIETSKLCRNLSALQQSGITLVKSLNITRTAIKNACLKKALEKATASIKISGMSLGTALAQAGGFPELMIQLIEVGVNAGQICEVLDRISDQYENDVDSAIKKVTSLIEPAMIVIVGALAGTVVISLFLPMYSIIDNI